MRCVCGVCYKGNIKMSMYVTNKRVHVRMSISNKDLNSKTVAERFLT